MLCFESLHHFITDSLDWIVDVKENVTGDGNKNKFRSNHIQILLIKNGRFIDADL